MSFFAISLDAAFVKQIWETEFGQAADFELRTAIGVEDPVIKRIGLLGRKELSEGGIGGRCTQKALARRWRYICCESTASRQARK